MITQQLHRKCMSLKSSNGLFLLSKYPIQKLNFEEGCFRDVNSWEKIYGQVPPGTIKIFF